MTQYRIIDRIDKENVQYLTDETDVAIGEEQAFILEIEDGADDDDE